MLLVDVAFYVCAGRKFSDTGDLRLRCILWHCDCVWFTGEKCSATAYAVILLVVSPASFIFFKLLQWYNGSAKKIYIYIYDLTRLVFFPPSTARDTACVILTWCSSSTTQTPFSSWLSPWSCSTPTCTLLTSSPNVKWDSTTSYAT